MITNKEELEELEEKVNNINTKKIFKIILLDCLEFGVKAIISVAVITTAVITGYLVGSGAWPI